MLYWYVKPNIHKILCNSSSLVISGFQLNNLCPCFFITIYIIILITSISIIFFIIFIIVIIIIFVIIIIIIIYIIRKT